MHDAPGALRRSVDEHGAILDAARAADAAGMERAVRAHIAGARERATALLAEAERPPLRRIRDAATQT